MFGTGNIWGGNINGIKGIESTQNIFQNNFNYKVTIEVDKDHGSEFLRTINYNRKEVEGFTKSGHKYYYVPHKSEYKVRMHNTTANRVNAILTIDGEYMGKWRINSHSDIVVERSAHNQRKFTFVRETGWEANMGGIVSGNSVNGLVEVKFVPEKKYIYQDSTYSLNNSVPVMYKDRGGVHIGHMGSRATTRSAHSKTNSFDSYVPNSNFSAGGTVFGDKSNQRFNDADYMDEDNKKAVTKRVRLVVDERYSYSEQPYTSIKSRSATDDYYHDDPIPPRIDDNDIFRPRFTDRIDFGFGDLSRNSFPKTR